MSNSQQSETSTTVLPSIMWAVVNTQNGKLRRVLETRTEARMARKDGERVIRFVADFNARA